VAKKPEFIQNLILEKIKEKVPGSKFTHIAKEEEEGAGLTIGNWDNNSWIKINPGKLTFQWVKNDRRGTHYTRIPLPSFEDPKFDPDKIINFVLRLVVRQRRVIDLVDSIREESEVDFYAISGYKVINQNQTGVIDYPGPEPVRQIPEGEPNPFKFR
jgi:hypothetical protein